MLIDTRSAAIVSFLFIKLLCLVAGATTTKGVDLETTTSNSIVIRRKSSSSRDSPGGGRLSLMNNRFNRRPRKKNLDPDQLLEILGSFYDPAWMSIDEPSALVKKDPERGASYVVRHDSWQYSELVKQLQMSNLSMELAWMNGQNVLEDPGLVKTVERWLLKKASCPVRYAWEDIGSLFWPRYIKRGECKSIPGTCSWPPGMHCVPSGTMTLHVLRWQCKVPKGKGRRKNLKNGKGLKNRDWLKNISEGGEQPINLKCSWIRVPYPITSDCLCTC